MRKYALQMDISQKISKKKMKEFRKDCENFEES